MVKDLEWLKEEVKKSLHPNNLNGKSWQDIEDTFMELIDQVEQPEKPVIPDYVANEIEIVKYIDEEMGDITYISKNTLSDKDVKDVEKAQKWKAEHINEYCLAFSYGYIVEEKRYYVADKRDSLLCKVNDKVMTVGKCWALGYEKKDVVYQLTQEEITNYDTRYWKFAEPAEVIE